jgi:hypothetical protein
MRRDVFLPGSARDTLGMVALVGLSFLAGRLKRRPARPTEQRSSEPGAPLPLPRPGAEAELRLELLEARLTRLEQLGARLALLEQRQLEVADNLCQANTAFRQWNDALRALRQQVQALDGRPTAQPPDQPQPAASAQTSTGQQSAAEADRPAP